MMLGIVEVFGLALFLVFLAAALAGTVLWIWMLVHAILNKGLTDNERLIWVLVIVFTHVIGALVYLFVGRPRKALAAAGRATA
jgi:hypothetical protein